MLDYANNLYASEGVITYTYTHNEGVSSQQVLNKCLEEGLHKEYFEAKKIIRANNVRLYRLRKRIDSMLSNYKCCFLTLTFRDDVFISTTDIERRKAVSRYLKSFGVPYVANLDFGAEKDREHYHALLCVESIDYKEWFEKFGAIKSKKVRLSDLDKSKSKLSKYICKLSNHAIKDTTKRSALLYSR